MLSFLEAIMRLSKTHGLILKAWILLLFLGLPTRLLDVIKRERPDHLAVCFDKGGSKDRVEMFKEYKANGMQLLRHQSCRALYL